MVKLNLGYRLWILIFFLVLSVIAISPNFQKGVLITSVEKNSTEFNEGLRQGMIITQINSHQINNLADYTKTMSELFQNNTNETKLTIKTSKEEFILFTSKPLDITAGNIPRTRLKTGLDLSGGARALVRPVNVTLSSSQMADLVSVTSQRFNVYGISDITVRPVKDLQGNNFMLVEIAGASPTDLKELVGKQGKFEAKIGNDTVFEGGKKDITSVCRNDQTCSRIESCSQVSGGYSCRFSFTIYLSQEAAQRHADITGKLGVNTTDGGRYLSQKLDLVVDDSVVDSLFISEDLKGKVATQISVSGSGSGTTQEEAFKAATESLKKLQTILITGSLPYKLEIVKLDTISPILGQQFIIYLFIAGFASILVVSLIIFIRYRNIKSSLAVLFTSFSEVLLILGFAALIKWNLDLVSIAGILTVIGTGVDQQIVILDESLTGKSETAIEKIKRAFFIVVGAFFTSLASLIPLYWAGAGLLRGFAVTTIIGITTGLLITRPAFMDLLKMIEK